jgi:hypothetical protein
MCCCDLNVHSCCYVRCGETLPGDFETKPWRIWNICKIFKVVYCFSFDLPAPWLHLILLYWLAPPAQMHLGNGSVRILFLMPLAVHWWTLYDSFLVFYLNSMCMMLLTLSSLILVIVNVGHWWSYLGKIKRKEKKIDSFECKQMIASFYWIII